MTPASYRIAVVADAHFHDIFGDFGLPGVATPRGRMTLRTLSETGRAQRLVNESHAALYHTLDDIAARGITQVVLLGDYSDDGQTGSLAGLARMLAGFTARHGMRFHALPGNHDLYGQTGRDVTRRYQAETGYDLASSDPRAADPGAGRVAVSPAMRCHGMPQALDLIPGLGYLPRRGDLLWETPFGTAAWPGRQAPMAAVDGTLHLCHDASYLVEPLPGLWLMMLDANVFRPAATGAEDASNAGWNAVLTHKPFLLRWMADVAARAARAGKQLLACTHYPVLDPLGGTLVAELALTGPTLMTRRIPGPLVAEAILSTGVSLFVSGHLHLNATARAQAGGASAVNICAPSLVGYPAAYKVLTLTAGRAEVQTVGIGDMALCAAITGRYRAEPITGTPAPHFLQGGRYGDLLDAHLAHLVTRRHLRREWPPGLAALIRSHSLGDIARLQHSGLREASLDSLPALTLLQDWYRLRMGGDLARPGLPPARLAAYARLTALLRDAAPATPPGQIARLLQIFNRYLDRPVSADFTIDLATGGVTAA